MEDCEQWFMDRIMRDRPIPIPGSGLQLVSLSHYEDCGKLMAAASGVPPDWIDDIPGSEAWARNNKSWCFSREGEVGGSPLGVAWTDLLL